MNITLPIPARVAISAVLLMVAAPAAAEVELSLYVGMQGVNDSKASGYLPGKIGHFNRKVKWDGKSLNGAKYYGGRVTWWTDNDLGFGIEGTHAKAYASRADRAAIGVDRMEFSDGHNILTANVMKRFPNAFAGSNFSPYVGAGAGIAVPHVDVRVTPGSHRTHGYELTGIALRGIAGMKYAINDNWSLFGEYQITWSRNDATIESGSAVADGKLKTDITTHAVNIGVSYSF